MVIVKLCELLKVNCIVVLQLNICFLDFKWNGLAHVCADRDVAEHRMCLNGLLKVILDVEAQLVVQE